MRWNNHMLIIIAIITTTIISTIFASIPVIVIILRQYNSSKQKHRCTTVCKISILHFCLIVINYYLYHTQTCAWLYAKSHALTYTLMQSTAAT